MKRRIFTIPTRQSIAGISLIEVLISVLVMAIGMLGIAAMQAMALRNSQSSLERSQAAIQAYTILDAMRANIAVANAGGYNQSVCTAPTAGTLVANDIARWLQGLKDSINATACGSINCNASSCQAVVTWDDSRAKDGNTTQRFAIDTRL